MERPAPQSSESKSWAAARPPAVVSVGTIHTFRFFTKRGGEPAKLTLSRGYAAPPIAPDNPRLGHICETSSIAEPWSRVETVGPKKWGCLRRAPLQDVDHWGRAWPAQNAISLELA